MSSNRIPGPNLNIPAKNNSNTVINCHLHKYIPGFINEKNHKPESEYSYSISGKVGVIGSMLFTEISQRLSGTLYDHTIATSKLRKQEADLGLSGFGDDNFKQSAKITLKSLKTPKIVDVNIYFETLNRIENITVRGSKGVRFFFFDYDECEKNSTDEEGLKPLYNIIDNILSAVRNVR